ncbi:MAG TPA: PRC-barrel domain-containing protein [Opitutus sp.]|nr:PRC-barrel domain-containing protein [Opitutus sp.]
MKPHFRTLAVLAMAASLPLAVSAQSSTGSSSTDTSSGRSSTGSTSGSTYSSPSSTSSSSNRSTSSMDSMHSSMSDMSSGAASIQTVSQSALDHQLTAKALIGKNVYDSQGKRIGEVKDVVLDSSRTPQLATAFGNREGARDTSSTSGSMNTSRTSTGTASTTADSNATLGSSIDSAVGSLSGAMSGGASVVISSGGFLGMGNDLIRVPLTQLNYDSSKDHFTLNVSQSEIANMTRDSSNKNRSATE